MMTISDFCKYAGIGRTTFYKLRREGNGPKQITLGTRLVRITATACREWEAQNLAKQNGAVVQRQKQQRTDIARRAGQRAAASPNHYSKWTPERRAKRKRRE